MIRFGNRVSYPVPTVLGFGAGGAYVVREELPLRPEVFLIFFFFVSAAVSSAARFLPRSAAGSLALAVLSDAQRG